MTALPLLALAWAAWIVVLVGLAIAEHYGKHTRLLNNVVPFQWWSRFLSSKCRRRKRICGVRRCHRLWSSVVYLGLFRLRAVLLHAPFDRWVFEAFISWPVCEVTFQRLLRRLAVAEVGAGFSLAHAAVASLLAVATVLTILQTDSKYRVLSSGTSRYLVFDWLTLFVCADFRDLRNRPFDNSRNHKAHICVFAGFLALSALNLLLLIVMGTQHKPGTSSHLKDEHNTGTQRVATGAQGYNAAPTGTQGYGTPATMV